MDPDDSKMQQMTEVWKHLLTPETLPHLKRLSEGGTSQLTQPKKRRSQGRQPTKTKEEDTSMNEVLKMLVVMTLRQEDQLKTLAQDHEFIIHMGTGQGGVLQELLQLSQQWHTEIKSAPLRHVLAKHLISTIHARLMALQECKKGSVGRSL